MRRLWILKVTDSEMENLWICKITCFNKICTFVEMKREKIES